MMLPFPPTWAIVERLPPDTPVTIHVDYRNHRRGMGLDGTPWTGGPVSARLALLMRRQLEAQGTVRLSLTDRDHGVGGTPASACAVSCHRHAVMVRAGGGVPVRGGRCP